MSMSETLTSTTSARLTSEQFVDSQSHRLDGRRRSASTIGHNASIINGFFDWLSVEGMVTQNPTRRNGDRIILRPRQVRPEENDNVTTISGDDVRKLLAVANKSDWSARLAVNTAIYSGARRKASSDLRISDYDVAGGTLRFREKGGRTITKPISDDLVRVIDAARADGVYERDDDYLIPSRAAQRRSGNRDDRIIGESSAKSPARPELTRTSTRCARRSLSTTSSRTPTSLSLYKSSWATRASRRLSFT